MGRVGAWADVDVEMSETHRDCSRTVGKLDNEA